MTDRISDDDLHQWIHDLEKADFRAYPGKAAQHAALCELRDLRAERDALRDALQMLYDEQMDYIKINKLCGAENNRVMVAARAALAAQEKT